MLSRPGIASRVIDVVVDAQEKGLGLLAHRRGSVIAANKTLCEILEVEVRPGMHLNELVHLSPVGYFKTVRAILSRSEKPYEVTITLPDGREKRLGVRPLQVGGVRVVIINFLESL